MDINFSDADNQFRQGSDGHNAHHPTLRSALMRVWLGFAEDSTTVQGPPHIHL